MFLRGWNVRFDEKGRPSLGAFSVRRVFGWLGWGVLGLLGLCLVAAGGGYWWLLQSLPKIDGEIVVGGLDQPVTIVRDVHGMFPISRPKASKMRSLRKDLSMHRIVFGKWSFSAASVQAALPKLSARRDCRPIASCAFSASIDWQRRAWRTFQKIH